VAARVAVIYLGTFAEVADAAELYRNPQHPYTQALLSAVPIPDPQLESARQRIILTGDVPSPDRERSGCPFHDRCWLRLEACATQVPRLRDSGAGHQVACFLHHPPEAAR
jgi:oligopeptide transport system ATP-binding protein